MARNELAESVVSRLEQQLLGLIASGRLAGGERLPSVRELTKQFGVSRGSVQIAVRELAARGLVRSVPRQGTVIVARDRSGLRDGNHRKGSPIGIIDLMSTQRFDDEVTQSWFGTVIRSAEYTLAQSAHHMVKAVYLQDDSQWVQKVWQQLDGTNDGMAGVILFADIASDELLISRGDTCVALVARSKNAGDTHVSPLQERVSSIALGCRSATADGTGGVRGAEVALFSKHDRRVL